MCLCGFRYDPDNKESLLNPANNHRAAQTMNNMRKSCNVAGNCQLQASGLPGAG
jgi:hypothetical protein